MAYNKKITVQAFSESRDIIGQDIQTWTAVGSFWAEIKTYGGKEYFAAAQVNSENDVLFKVRFSRLLSGYLSSQLRVIYQSCVYDVKSAVDVNQQHRIIEIRSRILNGGGADE